MSARAPVVYLGGGVGGARLLQGLAAVLDPSQLVAVVNTGDDFRHWGLWVSPDLDTVMYTLAELSDVERGWGLRGETFRALEAMRRYGGPDWFGLGDQDLATHLLRNEALAAGARLTDVTTDLCARLGVAHRVLPMADAPRATLIDTARGELPFQRWFVEHRAEPEVRGVRFEGDSEPTPEVLDALRGAERVVIGPSNPYVSIDPILTLRGVREALADKPVVAVSPLVHGRAVKGPLASMMQSLTGAPASVAGLRAHYGELLCGLVVEAGDEDGAAPLPVRGTATVMGGLDDRARLAREVLDFVEQLS